LQKSASSIPADRVADAANAFRKGCYDGIATRTYKELDSECTDAALVKKAGTLGFVEKEITGAFCAGYRGGRGSGEAKYDAALASGAASDMVLSAANESTHAELVKQKSTSCLLCRIKRSRRLLHLLSCWLHGVISGRQQR
jgi:hypothetical protein